MTAERDPYWIRIARRTNPRSERGDRVASVIAWIVCCPLCIALCALITSGPGIAGDGSPWIGGLAAAVGYPIGYLIYRSH